MLQYVFCQQESASILPTFEPVLISLSVFLRIHRASAALQAPTSAASAASAASADPAPAPAPAHESQWQAFGEAELPSAG